MNVRKRTVLLILLLCLLPALPALAANRFAFTEKTVTIPEGEILPTTLEREGTYEGDGEIVYTSGKPTVATVDAEGNITAVSKGQTTITATMTRNGKRVGQARLNVQVLRPVMKVTLSLQKLNVYDPDDLEIAPLLNEDTDYRVITVPEGGTVALSAVCTPEDASNKNVSFATTDAGVASIVNKKTLKGVQQGECDLIVSSVSDPDARESFHVLVTRPIRKIGITGPNSVAAGSVISLQALYTPDNASVKKVTWASRNPAVATVDADGNVTGVKRGSVSITATAADGSKAAASMSVTVTQPVTTVEVKQSQIAVNVGRTQQATASVQPRDASDRNLVWTSSDETIATAANGRITGKKAGECVVTCASRSNPDVSADIRVIVSQPVTKAEITNNPGEMSIRVGDELQLGWRLEPEDVTNRAVSFKSANPKVATVDGNGLVRGVSKGTVTVYVIAQDGSKRQGAAKVTVIQPVTGVEIQRSLYYVEQGSSAGVRAVVQPRNANNQKVYWSSEDEGICTVSSSGTSSGSVRGLSVGTTTVSAFTEDGGYTATTRIRVGKFNEAVMIEDVYVDDQNQIRIALRNMSSELTLEDIYYKVECFSTDGAPMICNLDGVSNYFEGSYPYELVPLDRTMPAGFRFRDDAVTQPLGAVLLTVTGWKDADGIVWTIPESERLTRQWTQLFPVG